MNGESTSEVDFGVLRARRIEIVGEDGSRRIELGTNLRGDAVLRLRDGRGTVRAVVSVQDDAPRFRLLDSAGQVRVSCMLRAEQPGLELLGSDGQPRLVMFLRAHEDEAPDLYFVDRDGDPRFGVAMDYNGHITLAAKDDAGHLNNVVWSKTEEEDEAELLY
jgi:hypothetical protein